MNSTISLNKMFQMLSCLSTSNKKWLADKLNKSVEEEIIAKEHSTECFMMYSAFKQVKALREGKLKTRDVKELLNECKD